MELLDSEDDAGIRSYLRVYRDEILTSSDTVVLALILWRRIGDSDQALALAEDARKKGLGDRRLIFEIAISHWQNNACHEAVPLFLEVLELALHRPDWMSRESADFLADCMARPSLMPRLEMTFGYDSNLGRTAPARKVIPETGSVAGEILENLIEVLPEEDLEQSLVIGTPARDGFWTEIRHALEWRYPSERGRLVFQLGSQARLTSRREYHGQAHYMAGWYRHQVGRHTLSGSLSLRHDTESLGPEGGRRQHLTRTMRLGTETALGRSFHLSTGLTGQKLSGQGAASYRSNFRSVDLGFIHDGSANPRQLTALGYQIIVMTGRETTTPRWNTGRHNSIAIGVGPVTAASRFSVRFAARADHTSFDHIRPWLRDRHDRRREALSLSVTYAFGSDHPVIIDIERYRSISRDPIDHHEGFKFSMHIRY